MAFLRCGVRIGGYIAPCALFGVGRTELALRLATNTAGLSHKRLELGSTGRH
jgi:hypothetical protein